ncbi:MAG TPA: hypothetical protein VFU50_05685 [Terriglobales bacterium]|nr:hypothetical protein [Terriglobales bacterium]
MSYRADKPYGRRKTDRPLSDEKRRHLQSIRRDVDEDPTGTIRRYLRLASKALDNGQSMREEANDQSWLEIHNPKAA